jgi:pimeloyl-ACP methyl ester carboxylesterase
MILNTLSFGDGPPLVLLHGLFGAARNLGQLARGLASHARVVAMDLRNHGDSPHAPAMDFATMAGDVADTITVLNLGPVRLAGHSLGGKTAMALALTQPALVSRLAVLDIAPIPYDHDYDNYVAAMRALKLDHALTRGAADAALAEVVKAAPMRAFLLNNLVLGAHPRWRVGLEEIAAAMPNLLDWRDPPGCTPYPGPALFLRGAQSHYVPPSATPAITRLFPHAVQESIPGAAHWLHADKPQETLASLKDFFFP